MVVCKKAYQKNFMQRTESKSWPGKNVIVPKTSRFSNHVVKGGMKTTGKGSPAAREPIVNKTKNTSEITKDNTVKTTGNGSTKYWRSYYAKNKEQIKQRLRDQKQRKLGQNIACILSLVFMLLLFNKRHKLCIRVFVYNNFVT